MLEYDKIIGMLMEHTVSVPGREMAQSLVPYTDRDKIISALAETEEALKIMVKYGMSPLGEFPNIRMHLRRVEKKATLSPEELLDIGCVLRTCASLKDAFKSREGLNDSGLTIIPGLVYQLKPHSDLMGEIFRCIEPDGRIADNASPELHGIRRNIARCQEKIKGAFEPLYTNDAVPEIPSGAHCHHKEWQVCHSCKTGISFQPARPGP